MGINPLQRENFRFGPFFGPLFLLVGHLPSVRRTDGRTDGTLDRIAWIRWFGGYVAR